MLLPTDNAKTDQQVRADLVPRETSKNSFCTFSQNSLYLDDRLSVHFSFVG